MIPSIRPALLAIFALAIAALPVHAQETKIEVEVRDSGKAEPGKEWTLKLRFPIPEGFHAYHKDNPGNALPLKVTFKELSGLKEVKQTWPEPKKVKDEYGEEWELFGNVDIAWTFAVPADAKGKLAISAEYEVQYCDEHGCYIAEGKLETSVEVAAAAAKEVPKGPSITASGAFDGEVKPGGKAVLALTFEVSKGFSAYHKDSPGLSKPMVVKFSELGGLKLESETWPEPKKVKEEWADKEDWKLSGKFTIKYTFDVPADAKGEVKVAGDFEAQICDEDGCHDRKGTFNAAAKVGTVAEEKKNDARDAHGFYLDFDFALAEARRLNKPLLIDFNGKFCVPCRRMEREVFTLPEVHKLMEGFVVVSLMTDVKDPRANELFAKYRPSESQGAPYYAVLDHNEKLLRGIGSTLPGSTHWVQFAAFLKGEAIPEVGAKGTPGPVVKNSPQQLPADWPSGLPAPKPADLAGIFDFEPVFTAAKVKPGSEVTLELRFRLKTGAGGAYHLYHPDSPHAKELGASLLLLETVDVGGLTATGPWEFPKPFLLPANHPKNQFKVDEWQFHDDFRVVRRFKLPADAAEGTSFRVTGTLAGQYCDEGSCTWFVDMDQTPFGWLASVTASASGESGAIAAPTMAEHKPAPGPSPKPGPTIGPGPDDLSKQIQDKGLLLFLLSVFGLGMVTLLTPCVLPVLPLTVAFFVKQSEQGRSPLVAASIYCGCIVVAFTTFGLITSLVLGEQGAQIISTNAWVNIAIGVLFFVFALSFFGMFELRMPTFLSSWISRKQMNAQQQGKGYATALLSGGSFAVISFSCTGPIAATLLAGVATGFGGGEGATMGRWVPTLAMFVFALGLAAPIFVLGQFPNLLKRLPKSGAWMNALKVVFAFIEVAIAIRYFSWAEIAFTEETVPTWISRELVDSVWIACAVGAGLYLLGTFRMPHDHEKTEQIGVVRMLIAMCFLAFGAYLIPGLVNGKPMGLLDGFLPPRAYHAAAGGGGGGGSGGGASVHALKWHQNLDDGLAEAKSSGKPVFIDFTGKICANCRWVETNIMPSAEVLPMLQSDFVLVQQWTDVKGDQAAKDNYKKYGIGSKGVPMYVIVDADGNMIEKFVPPQFINTLKPAEFAEFMSRAKGKLHPTG